MNGFPLVTRHQHFAKRQVSGWKPLLLSGYSSARAQAASHLVVKEATSRTGAIPTPVQETVPQYNDCLTAVNRLHGRLVTVRRHLCQVLRRCELEPTWPKWSSLKSSASLGTCTVQTMSTSSESSGKPNVVFILGGPGAGKGTQSKKIVENFPYEHLSAGDLLREERNRPNSEFGELIETHIRNGSIVPVEITCSLLERAMINSNMNNFLIDGFPRNEDNLQGWTRQMGDKAIVKFVLFFKCDEETCIQRCLGRGASGSGRSDDNMESLRKRFVTYVESTMPIVEHFRKQNLVVEIDASKSAEEVFDEVKKYF